MIELTNVSMTYRVGSGLTVLKDACLRVASNDYLGIVGPSGSGKSTLLHILGLLEKPTAGHYAFKGRDVGGLSDDERSRLRGSSIGFVFQSFNLIPNLSVMENVEVPLFYQGVPRAERSRRAAASLDQVGMTHRIEHMPTQLSGGERQRTAIARALVSDPELLLADEPTGNLDQSTGREILGLFDGLQQSGRTIIMITHDRSIASRLPRQIEIVDGVIREKTS